MAFTSLDKDRFLLAVSQFPPPPGITFSYGTAGFRMCAQLLDSTAFRTGILAALRSICVRSTTGVMITASHNPVSDNGVKVADSGGGMLAADWEPFADALANATSAESVLQLVEDFIVEKKIIVTTFLGRVLLARDTRPSGERLLDAARQGIEAVSGATAIVEGVLTTPQLHWMVHATNRGHRSYESDYFTQLSNGFRQLCEMKPSRHGCKTSSADPRALIVDGSNGVGASKLLCLQELIQDFKMEIRNSGKDGEGELNELTGADFVQKEKVFPHGFGFPNECRRRCASLDGDADRIVFFYGKQSESGPAQTLQLLDGDKTLTLFAIFITQQLQDLVQCGNEDKSYSGAIHDGKLMEVPGYGQIKFGVVQTAYANGSSTKFLRENLGIEVVLTATGVKNLHHRAAEYDIGIYFEANGHGMVLFKDEFLQWLRKEYPYDIHENIISEEKNAISWKSARRLLVASEVVNQAIGDALSVLLLVEVVLQYMGWSIQEWDAIYSDLPSRQLKVKVKNRGCMKTTNAETMVTSPSGLQEAINLEVEKVTAGRAFVRPSGTEDFVRVYAEAATQSEANFLAVAVAKHVHRLAGGVGPPP